MDKNKENNFFELLKEVKRFEAIFKPLPILELHNKIINSDQFKTINTFGELNKKITIDFEWINNFKLLQQSFTSSIQESFKIIDAVQKELKERNIDADEILNLPISEIIRLYSLSGKSGLGFADLVEDGLKLFGCIKYEQVVTYLELLNSRKKQIIKNEIKSVNFNDKSFKNLKDYEESAGYYIRLKLEAYEKGEIKLTPDEKKLLNALKQNNYLKNTDLAKSLGYGVRGIEAICAKIRKKFEMDFEEKNAKRLLLITLANDIEL